MTDDNDPKTNASADSTLTRRSQLATLAGQHFGGDRDLYQTFGYPRHIDVNDYMAIYMRQDLAGRIVDSFPDATWREQPEVTGAIEDDYADLESRLDLTRNFHRLDRLAGVGHYGVLLLGLDGGEPMHEPARKDGGYNLLYVKPHSERTAEITHWEDDPSSPRYGLPKLYRITTGVNWTGTGAGQKTLTVHHSRVIHVAERALEDASIGMPRLERVYNRLMDLDKLLGGSAEVFWQNAAMLRAYIADKDVEWGEAEQAQMAEQIEEMQHNLRRDMRLRGVTPQNLGGDVADPASHIDKQLDAISGATGIPKRILIGSERGELSSEQDENNWAGRIQERREQHASPAVIEQFIAKGQRLGFLSRGKYSVEWPESDTLGEKGRAEIAKAKANAVNAFMKTPGAETVVSPDEFRDWLGLEGSAEMPAEEDLPEDDEEVQSQWQQRQS